jgi:hypothetical protein
MAHRSAHAEQNYLSYFGHNFLSPNYDFDDLVLFGKLIKSYIPELKPYHFE